MPYQSVLDDLPTFEWNSQESVSYEDAIEAICFAVAALTAAIDDAEQRGDEQRVGELVEIRKRCPVERDQLRSTDHAVVAEVTRRYRDLSDRLQVGRD